MSVFTRYKGGGAAEFQDFVPKPAFTRYCCQKTQFFSKGTALCERTSAARC